MNFTKHGIIKTLQNLKSKNIKFLNFFKVSFLEIALIAFISGIILLGCVGIGAFKGILASAKQIDALDVVPTGYATLVYDCEGHEMTKLVAAESNRSYVTMDKIPQYLADAFVAVEDSRFYTHNGIDIKGIIRAAYEGVKSGGKFSQGASTITQQLIKNNVFDSSWVNETNFVNKFKRKIQEQYLAVELEKELSKTQILEYYMNTINLGQNTLGVQAASQRYFGKPVYQLTLSEAAVIAGTTKNPAGYNPISHPDKNAERREKVLKDMYEQGYITKEEYVEALEDDVYSRIQKVNEDVKSNSVNSYFVDELTDQVAEDLQTICGYDEGTAYKLLYSGGLKIYSTQNPEIQSICDSVFADDSNYAGSVKYLLNYQLTVDRANGEVENFSTEMFKSFIKQSNPKFELIYNSEEDANADIEKYKESILAEGGEVRAENITLTIQPQASITVMDQSTGYVVAMVGGRGTKTASKTLNRASTSERQPGSLFKVLSTYAPAIDAYGFTLANVQNDLPFTYKNGRPIKNWYGQNYRGISSLRTGIAQSLNIVTVKVLTQIDPMNGFRYLQNFGFTTLVEREVMPDGTVMSDTGQALALGGITHGVTNLETTAAFASIANGGVYNKPTLYTKITDSDGNVIIDQTVTESHRVIQETTAFLLTSAMHDVVTSGTGTQCNFGNMAIAGKTGTTSDYNDIWFSGYTPYYTATVWAGYDNNVNLPDKEHNIAKSLWRGVMSQIHANLPNPGFSMPNGITTCSICTKSGKLPNELCMAAGCVRTEYFTVGTEPTELCDIHYMGKICAYDGKIACPNCPFAVDGVAELPLVESPLLDYGQLGNIIDNHCCHNDEFYLQPDYQQQLEDQRRQVYGY